MNMPFPGMDPYLEHPLLWPGIHVQFMVALANHLQPLIEPRYVASVEERVFEDNLEIHETYIQILDLYNEQKLVALLEVLSRTNKARGPGRKSYRAKQNETRARDCHIVEIDLLRRGRHVLSIPKWRAESLKPYHYLVCVSRWPLRHRFELYPRQLRERLPRINLPLAEPDSDVTLDLQAVLEQVYRDGRYMRRVRYDEPCVPPLSAEDQQWANDRWSIYRSAQS